MKTSPALTALPWLAICAISAAQEPVTRQFGTQDTSILHVPAAAFVPTAETDPADGKRYETDLANGFLEFWHPDLTLWASVSLPTGARIVSFGAYFQDDAGFDEISACLRAYRRFPNTISMDLACVETFTTPGRVFLESPVNHTVNNDLHASSGLGEQYAVVVFRSGVTLNGFSCRTDILPPPCHIHFKGADIVWTRQLSPAPGTATFGDVPTTHIYFRAIEALAASGITAGCGSGNFCPNGYVSRGELAAFLARALGLHWPN